jgi:hypothetical protein
MLLSAALEAALNAEGEPACATDEAGAVVFLNVAWDKGSQLAPRTQSRWLLGRHWLESMTADLRPFYASLHGAALQLDAGSQQALLHVSECNTPTQIHRSLTWFVPACADGRTTGVVMLYALHPLGAPQELYDVDTRPLVAFRERGGRTHACSCCRRVRAARTNRWLFVAEALSRPSSEFIFSLCAPCRESYRVAPTTVVSPLRA